MIKVFIAGKEIRLEAKHQIGSGGEAQIFDIGSGKALKLFKAVNHPDLVGNQLEQDAAKKRLQIHQTKLAAFPKMISNRIVRPEQLVNDDTGAIVGYTMTFLKGMELLTMLSQRSFRDAGYDNKMVSETFKDINQTVKTIHNNKIVIGDFNDLNIMVDPNKPEAYFLDVDSWQYGPYMCGVFTQRFVDPLLCDPSIKSLMLAQPHTLNSDWYAFTTMLFYSLLFVGPYGGIYRPKDLTQQIKHDERPLHRISVFNPDVKYPKPATKYEVLDDALIQYFYETYEKDKRGEFPPNLLNMTWKNCAACGLEYARNHCPSCTLATPVTIKSTMEIRGTVTSRTIFKIKGKILYATYQDKLRFVYEEDGVLYREGKVKLINGNANNCRLRITKSATHIGKNNNVVSIDFVNDPKAQVDTYGNLPIFDANSKTRFWVQNGKLRKSALYGAIDMGDVLANQTLFWVGETMGFGFYRAANICVGFVFNPDKQGINDSVKLNLKGQLIDSTCVFTKDLAWFFVTLNDNGRLMNHCYVINNHGNVLATHSSDADGTNWLSHIRGNAAAGNFLLVPTDEGIQRVEIQGNGLVTTKKFPDTEPFVNSAAHLFATPEGLYVVDRNEIRQLEIK